MHIIAAIVFAVVALISWGVMGVEIFANGMDTLVLIEVCAWIMLVCLIGLLGCALYRLFKSRRK